MRKQSPNGLRETIYCLQCNTELQVIPALVGVRKFCSKNCADKWKSINKRGENCTFYKGGLATAKCNSCGREIKRYKKYLDNKTNVFCNHACYSKFKSEHWKKDNNPKYGDKLKQYVCVGCGSLFSRYVSGKFDNRYCSFDCYSTHTNKSSTTIENALEHEFITRAIPYRKQVKINKMIVDFLLLGGTIVQCDGDYWHNLPNVATKDIRQNKELIDKGYNVIRFWEKDIKSSPSQCVDHIQAILRTHRAS